MISHYQRFEFWYMIWVYLYFIFPFLFIYIEASLHDMLKILTFRTYFTFFRDFEMFISGVFCLFVGG